MEEPKLEAGRDGEEEESFAYEIDENPDDAARQGDRQGSPRSAKVGQAPREGKRPYVVPCQYEIENSKQFLLLTGQSHDELRVIVESFLQANVKMRTKYKCACMHHCLLENPSTCDSYNIVKNIIG